MIREGDWVEYTSRSGKRIEGYVLYNVSHKSLVRVTSPKSLADQDKLINTGKLKKIEPEIHPDDVNILIDLALATKDKEWFDELQKISAKQPE